jgi:hypothetical protein
MKRNKLNQYESKSASEPSPEQIQQSKQTFVNLLAPIVEKMLKSPGDIKPVAESFEELARQAKSGVKRSAELTKIISGGSSELPKNVTKTIIEAPKNVTKFSSEELEILRKIENGEH